MVHTLYFDNFHPVFNNTVFHNTPPVFHNLHPVFKNLPPVFHTLRLVFKNLPPVFHNLSRVFHNPHPVFHNLHPVCLWRVWKFFAIAAGKLFQCFVAGRPDEFPHDMEQTRKKEREIGESGKRRSEIGRAFRQLGRTHLEEKDFWYGIKYVATRMYNATIPSLFPCSFRPGLDWCQ